jgi:hypothetical protein
MIKPDLYEGSLIEPGQAQAHAPKESSTFELIAEAIEALYAVEPQRTRALLELLRAASVSDLQKLFGA